MVEIYIQTGCVCTHVHKNKICIVLESLDQCSLYNNLTAFETGLSPTVAPHPLASMTKLLSSFYGFCLNAAGIEMS